MIYLILGILFILLLIYIGYKEYSNIKIVEENLELGLKGRVKIIFISDIQYDNPVYYLKKLSCKVVNMVNNMHPDIIILGGDIIHGGDWTNKKVLKILGKLKAPHIIGVLGNHDYYDLPEVKKFYKDNNFILLRNKGIELMGIRFYGVDDHRSGNPQVDNQKYDILISHNPDYFEEVPLNYSKLGISGHFHGGQIVLFGKAPAVISEYGQKYRYGWTKAQNMNVYVSSGLGGWLFNLPVRHNASPEIVVWNIK